MSKYSYYPGCSLTGANKAYHNSIDTVFKELEITLEEIQDWNCCGTTAYLATKEMQALGLTARNLAIASKMGNDEVIVPCNGCFTNFRKTNEHMKTMPAIRKKIDHALEKAGLDYQTNVAVRHPLDILVNEIGEEEIGGIYEALLDFQPRYKKKDSPIYHFILDEIDTERKGSGTYYTPKGLIDILLKTALKPVVENKLKGLESKE